MIKIYKIVRKRNNKNDKVPYHSKKDLEELAIKTLTEYNIDLINNAAPIPIESIMEQYYNLELDFQYLSSDGSVLGLTAFETGYLEVYNPDLNKFYPIDISSGTIIIDSALAESNNYGRYRFTCGHEFGHWKLHKELFFTENKTLFQNQLYVKCLNRDVEKSIDRQNKTSKDWIEWQADYFSSALLMPYPTIREYFDKCKKSMLKDITDELYSEYTLNNKVIEQMSNYFEVSKEAMRIRLFNLNLIS